MRSALFVPALTVALVISGSLPATRSSPFDNSSPTRTMRVDYFHTGDPGRRSSRSTASSRTARGPAARRRLLDDLNLGTYFFEVIDPGTNQPIYSRGFASIYGEWEATDEAKTGARTFHESLRFPWPKAPVQVVLKKRDKDNVFREIWTTASIRLALRQPPPTSRRGKGVDGVRERPADEKVDLADPGRGLYRGGAAEVPRGREAARRQALRHRAVQVPQERLQRACDRPSVSASGVNRPHAGEVPPHRGVGRVLHLRFRALHADLRQPRAARRRSAAPYEFIEILVNEKQYGGGGIYNFQATAAVDTAFSEYVFVHEFGHHFAGLADEYYMSPVAYDTGAAEQPEPWEPNVTALRDPAQLEVARPRRSRRRRFRRRGTRTPSRSKSARLPGRRRALRVERNAPEARVRRALPRAAGGGHADARGDEVLGKVGAFEGAAYQAKGLYRPQTDCIMFTRDEVGFCRVCRKAIERVIDLYARP